MSIDSNIYAFSRMQALRDFADYASGSSECLFLAVQAGELSDDSSNALVKSAEYLGYGPNGVTFLRVDGAHGTLSADQLFCAIEGMDPLCVVLADADGARLFAQAYRIVLPQHPALRVFGREVRLLPNLDELVTTPQGKQTAWSALKTLPHLGKG